MQNTIPKSPFNSNPIKIQININKGCIPKVDDINLGSKNWRNKKINIYNINNEIAEKIFPELYEIKIRGYVPILAHVERYKEVQENVNIIYDCIKEGALIQVNSSSIIGKNGKEAERVSEILLNNNMIHFIATDAHSSTRRRPIIRETYDYIVRKYGEQKAEILFIQNPYKVIEDKEISIESPRKYEKSKGFFKKLFKK